MSGVRETWSQRTAGRIGGGAYDFGVERELLARPAGLALWGTDTRVLLDSIDAVSDLPDGSAVLDIPCGGGLAAAVREIARCLAPGGRLVGDAVVRRAGWRQDLVIAAFQRGGFF